MTDVEYEAKDLEMILKIMGSYFKDEEPNAKYKKLIKKTEVKVDENIFFSDFIYLLTEF